MTIFLNISDSIKILSSSMLFFMSSHAVGFTFNLVTWYLEMIWQKFLEMSSFQVLMTLIFVLPWVQWPWIWMLPLAPYSWLRAMLPHSDIFPFYNLSFQSGDASSARSSIWEDPEPPEMVLATFSGASPFHTRQCWSHIIWKHRDGSFTEDRLLGQVGVHH